MSQKAAEEEERYKKEMEKYGANFGFNLFCFFHVLFLRTLEPILM